MAGSWRPVTRIADIADAIGRGVACVRGGQPCLVDVHIDQRHGRDVRESLADRPLAKAMGENNIKKVKECFSWEIAARKVEHVYSQLVKK